MKTQQVGALLRKEAQIGRKRPCMCCCQFMCPLVFTGFSSIFFLVSILAPGADKVKYPDVETFHDPELTYAVSSSFTTDLSRVTTIDKEFPNWSALETGFEETDSVKQKNVVGFEVTDMDSWTIGSQVDGITLEDELSASGLAETAVWIVQKMIYVGQLAKTAMDFDMSFPAINNAIDFSQLQFPFRQNVQAFLTLFGVANFGMCYMPLGWFCCARLITDKKIRVRELMRVMGLSTSAYYFSQFLALLVPGLWTILLHLIALGATGAIDDGDSFIKVLVVSLCYLLSFISGCFLFSAFFQTVYWAYAVVTLCTYVLPYSLLFPSISWGAGANFVLSLFSPIAYLYGMTDALADTPDLMEVKAWAACGMILLDAAIYMLLALYLQAIFPSSDWGAPLPWYFPFVPAYWKKGNGHANHEASPLLISESEMSPRDEGTATADHNNESRNGNFQRTEFTAANLAVNVEGLIKQYSGNDRRSVDELILKIPRGGIYALLGHNGAGKTTTICMLTGLIPPSGYEVATVNGFDVNTQMQDIQHTIGVCPQHDVLFDEMTAQQHLQLYASLKGMSSAETKEAIPELLTLVGLEDLLKTDKMSRELSGGMKRKLSLAISLIGNPQLVFLDEPSSGMDPLSRRKMWDILEQVKNRGTTILLTTHYMEEADVLGDTIGIMVAGKLHCSGDSSFLKSRFAMGYCLRFALCGEKKWNDELDDLISKIVLQHVPSAEKQAVAGGGSPSYILPVDSMNSFPPLFDDLDKFKAAHVQDISGYGLSTNTLEDVFINISKEFDHAEDKPSKQKTLPDDSPNHSSNAIDVSMAPCDDLLEIDLAKRKLAFFAQMFSLMYRRFVGFLRSPTEIVWYLAVFFLVILPVLIGASSLSNAEAANDYRGGGMKASIVDLDGGQAATDFVNEMKRIADWLTIDTFKSQEELYDETAMGVTSFSYEPPFAAGLVIDKFQLPLEDDSIKLSLQYGTQAEHRYGPAVLMRVALQAIGNLAVTNATKPILTDPEFKLISVESDSGAGGGGRDDDDKSYLTFQNVGISLMLGLVLLCAYSCMQASTEIHKKVYHSMRILGLMESSYCVTHVLVDFLLLWGPLLAFIGACQDSDSFPAANGTAFTLIVINIIIFFLTISTLYILLTLLIGHRIKPFMWFLMLFGLHFGLSFLPLILSTLLDRQGNVHNAPGVLVYFTPQMCLSGIFELADEAVTMLMIQTGELTNLSKKDLVDFRKEYLRKYESLVAGQLIWLGVAALALAILLFFRNRPNSSEMSGTPPLPDSENADVTAERRFVEDENNAMPVSIRRLRKMYGPKVAVNCLSLGFRKGECFGLLGHNGAGKSTTINTLVATMRPTQGTIVVNDTNYNDNSMSQLYRNARIGLCSQEDTIWDHLTAGEHLKIALRTRYGYSITRAQIKEITDHALEMMGLAEHTKKQSKAYSGGMKRKLCVIIAMYTGGKIIFLDEPSSGMDPFSRRSLWKTIQSNLTPERCVVLTTHSMEEAEAVCGRLSIMSAGKLQCLGTAQHLKNQFSGGYVTEIQMPPQMQAEQVHAELSQDFPGAAIIEKHGQTVRIGLGQLARIGSFFTIMEAKKAQLGLINYSLEQNASLESIFLKFAAAGLSGHEEPHAVPSPSHLPYSVNPIAQSSR